MGKDKIKHFIVCMTIAIITAVVVACTAAPVLGCSLAGFSSGMWAGVAKEYADRITTGWDWWDLVADSLGSAIGSLAGFIALII